MKGFHTKAESLFNFSSYNTVFKTNEKIVLTLDTESIRRLLCCPLILISATEHETKQKIVHKNIVIIKGKTIFRATIPLIERSPHQNLSAQIKLCQGLHILLTFVDYPCNVQKSHGALASIDA